MSAISWRNERTRQPAAEHALAPIPRLIPWLGLGAGVALLAYPHPLVWPAALLGALITAWLIAKGSTFGSPLINAGMALFLVSLLIGAGAGDLTDAAQVRMTGYGAALILVYVLLALTRSDRARAGLAIAIALVGGIAELVVLGLLRGSLPSSPFTRLLSPFTSLFAGFSGISGDTLDVNARFAVHQYGLAHLTLVTAPFGLALALSPVSRRWRIAGALWAAADVVLLLATQSRGAVLALAVVAAIIGSTRTRWAWAAIPGAAVVLGILIARGTISRQIESDWLDSRLTIWGQTMHMLGDFPFTGVGLGARTFAEAYAWYFNMPDRYAVSHTHNIALQAYAEQGTLGVLGLVALVLGGCMLALRAINDRSRPYWAAGAGAGGAFLGSALYGLTDQVVTSTISLSFMLACLAVIHRPRLERLTGQTLSVGTRGRVLAAIGIVAFTSVLLLLALGGRWLSGLALNAGSLELMHALVWPEYGGEQRQDALRRAEGWLVQATTLNQANISAWRNLAWARTARNDIAGAHDALDRAAAAKGLNEFERLMLGRFYHQLGFTEQAIEQWREAGDVGRLKAVVPELTSRGRWREAVAAHAALLTLEPANAEHMSNLAVAVLNSGGNLEEALRWFGTATTLNPNAARNLARQLVLRGEPYRINEGRGGGDAEKAIFWFTLASRVDPTYDRPEVEIGAVYMNRQRYVDAEQHFRLALARDDTDASLWSWIGEALDGQGRYVESVEYYRGAVQRRPDRAVLQEKLRQAETRAGLSR